MLERIKRRRSDESGEIMLEGMIVVLITIFVLIWLMSLCFLYYERYVTTVVTNDAAVKVAATYNNPTADIVMGYVTSEALFGRDLYRGFTAGSPESDLAATNEFRANGYINYALNRMNFVGVVKDVEVQLEMVQDSNVRRHIKLTTTCSYNTPLGGIFDMFDMDTEHTFSVTSCADCTDYAEYFSTIGLATALAGGTFTAGSGLLDSTLKMINSFTKLYNHFHDRSTGEIQ